MTQGGFWLARRRIFRIKDTLPAWFSFSTLPFRPSLSSRRDQKKLFCTGAPPSVLPSRKPARALTRTDFPATFLPATLTTGHASGGLGARPSAARLPPPSSPPSQHMQSLPWVRWQGHWPGPRPRDRGEGAHMWPRRREGEGQRGDAETHQGSGGALLRVALGLTRTDAFLPLRTSRVATPGGRGRRWTEAWR